jgi:hypothetical protein
LLETNLLNSRELIEGVNEREIGFSCYREVDFFTGKIGTSRSNPNRQIRIRTLRLTSGDVSSTLFCAVAPAQFDNLSFLLTEKKGCYHPFYINLHLPYGTHQTLLVDNKRRFQEFFASDFAYNDVKTWLCTEYQDYTLEQNFNNSEDIVLTGTFRDKELVEYAKFERQVLFLDLSRQVVNKCVYYEYFPDAERYKELHHQNYFRDGDIFIQELMIMANYKTKTETSIVLKNCWHNRSVDNQIFQPSNFKEMCECIKLLGQ